MHDAAPAFRPVAFAVLVLFHLLAFGAFFTGVSLAALAMFVVVYSLQMFGATAGYHRFFAHRTFKAGPVMRFVLAFLALTTLQRPIRWWAATHRDHHRHSDQPRDLHSPVVHGFWRSHFTWPFFSDALEPRGGARDLEAFAEVVWLDRYWRAPFLLLVVVAWALLGVQGVIVGVIWATLGTYHATGAINSLAHMVGSRTFPTKDQSRNSFWLALLTFGEGWHNNHHHYMLSTRQGFAWWQIDLTWMALRVLEKLGLVWDLREPPGDAIAAARGEVVLEPVG